jgi:hypothetical protein
MNCILVAALSTATRKTRVMRRNVRPMPIPTNSVVI